MYRVTYLRITANGPEIVTVTHPNKAAAMAVHDALRMAGVHVRLWDKGSQLVKPS